MLSRAEVLKELAKALQNGETEALEDIQETVNYWVMSLEIPTEEEKAWKHLIEEVQVLVQ